MAEEIDFAATLLTEGSNRSVVAVGIIAVAKLHLGVEYVWYRSRWKLRLMGFYLRSVHSLKLYLFRKQLKKYARNM